MNIQKTKMNFQKEIEILSEIEVLSKNDFPKIDNLIYKISKAKKERELTDRDISKINSFFGSEFINNTMQGHALQKPYGYAGDFMIIDKIYTQHKSTKKEYKIWDEYFQQQAAPKAVRNRKEYFKTIVKQKVNVNHSLKILNVASGPARDVQEVFKEITNTSKLKVSCIEMDENAIRYAENLTSNFSDNINFIHKNSFKYSCDSKYDLIWSAGLFDYFNDKAFIWLLKKFKTWLTNSGEIVIGNFNENHNPSRDFMELFGEWYLTHRTEGQLFGLAVKAGFSRKKIWIGKEPENVNLFLHISL